MRELFQPTEDDRHELERLVDAHGRELDERAAELVERMAELARREERTLQLRSAIERMLLDGSAELDARQETLNALAAELAEREAGLQELEQELAERRQEVGAVELHRASVERRERALAEREEALEAISLELVERQRRLGAEGEQPQTEPERAHVLFVSGDRYRLVPGNGPPPALGADVDLDGVRYRVVGSGASPLPGDPRRCVLVEPARPAAEPD